MKLNLTVPWRAGCHLPTALVLSVQALIVTAASSTVAEDPPPPCSGSPPYRFTVQASVDGGYTWSNDSVWIQGPPGHYVYVKVRTLMTVTNGETQGWSFSLKHDPSWLQYYGGSLSIASATSEGTDTSTVQEGAPPDFEDTEIRAGFNGYTQGVMVDTSSVLTLPPVTDFVTSRACYFMTLPYQTGNHQATLKFTHDIANPAVRSVVAQDGRSVVPCARNLTLYVYVSPWAFPTAGGCGSGESYGAGLAAGEAPKPLEVDLVAPAPPGESDGEARKPGPPSRIVRPKFELIVELRDASLRQSLESDLGSRMSASWQPVFPRATKKGAEKLARFWKATFASRPDRESAATYLRTHAAVQGVERPQAMGGFLLDANDPYFLSSGTWGQAYRDQWGLLAIRAPEAWEHTTGDNDLVIAVVDSGVHYKHIDLKERLWINPAEDLNGNMQFDDWPSTEVRNGVSGDLNGQDGDPGIASTQNGYVDDVIGVNVAIEEPAGAPWDVSDNDQGHGTPVAGVACAATNNGTGMAGVNWSSRIMVVKSSPVVFGVAAEGIVYAVENGARVINASWFVLRRSAVVEAALDYAYTNRVVVCVAAGNSGVESETKYPQSDPRVLNITAMNAEEEPLSVPGFGATDFGARTDIAAPGGGKAEDTTQANGHRNILSTVRNGVINGFETVSTDPDFHFSRVAGTSFAAPHAAGVVSLVLSLNPNLDVEQVRQVLRLGAVDIDGPGWDPKTGPGRLDALNSVLLANDPLGKARIFTPVPRSDISISSLIRIRGTAWAPAFDHYELMIGAGTDPAAFQAIGTGTQPIEDGVLLEWDPTPLGLSQGQHMLRLVVHGDGRQYEDRMTVFVGPPPEKPAGPLVLAGTPPVVGDVDGDGEPEIVAFSRARESLLVVLGGDATIEASVELESCLVNASPFFGGPALGELDTTSPGLEIAILEFDQVRVIHGDGTEVAGWPRPIDIHLRDFYQQPTEPEFSNRVVLEDLDRDGQLEILAFRLTRRAGGGPPQDGSEYTLTAFSASGAQTWEVTFGEGNPVEPGTIAVGDVRGPNADPEIVLLQGEMLRILNGAGVEVEAGSLGLTGRGDRPSLALADLVGDAKLDIVASQSTDKGLSVTVWVFDVSGGDLAVAAGWPRSLEPSGGSAVSGAITALAIGDLDGSLPPEIVVNLSDEIAVLKADGSELIAPAPLEEPGILAPLVLADVSGDGRPEVVVATATGGLRAFNLQNGEKEEWDLPFGDPPYAPAAWDLDGDSRIEVIAYRQGDYQVGCTSFDIQRLGTVGIGIPHWPMAHGGARRTGAFGESARFLRGDANGDCKLDISDAPFTLGFLFAGTAPPKCEDAVDSNNDGAMNVSDPQYVLNYLFLGGPPPPQPQGCPGVEGALEDALTCAVGTCPACP